MTSCIGVWYGARSFIFHEGRIQVCLISTQICNPAIYLTQKNNRDKTYSDVQVQKVP